MFCDGYGFPPPWDVGDGVFDGVDDGVGDDGAVLDDALLPSTMPVPPFAHV